MKDDSKKLTTFLQDREGPVYLVQNSRRLRRFTFFLCALVLVSGSVLGLLYFQESFSGNQTLLIWSCIVWLTLLGNLFAVAYVTSSLEKQSAILKAQFDHISEWKVEYERLFESVAVDLHETMEEMEWHADKLDEFENHLPVIESFDKEVQAQKESREKTEKELEALNQRAEELDSKIEQAQKKTRSTSTTVRNHGKKISKLVSQQTAAEEAASELSAAQDSFKKEQLVFKKKLDSTAKEQTHTKKQVEQLNDSTSRVNSILMFFRDVLRVELPEAPIDTEVEKNIQDQAKKN